MKKAMAVVMASTMALSLAACGGNTSSSSGSTPAGSSSGSAPAKGDSTEITL